MAGLPEKSDFIAGSEQDVGDDMTDMYHAVLKDTREDLKTEGKDVGDMYRMGKEQKFRRIFRLSTMIMFTSMIQSTWETVLVAPAGGLANGGPAGLFWSYIWTFLGFVPIVLSLAEMASMAPTSGGQYHWVSEFAPRKYQKFLSYMSGWMATTSWQAGTAGASYFLGTMIQGTIAAYNPNYVPTKWQGTLFVFATALVTGIVNVFMVNQLPRIQKLVMIPHGLGWIAVIIFLWTLAPHATAKQAFVELQSNGGWQPIGLSLMVGQITSVYFMILSDSAAHLSEEVKTASKSVPRAMVYSFFGNSFVGFIVLITFIFALPDVQSALSASSGYAFMYVFQQASYKGAIPLIVIIQMVVLTGTIDSNASTSRQTFAFARDNGLPMKTALSKVTTLAHQTVPMNAVLFTCFFSCLLSLINLGSTVAFEAIISLQLMALMATYSISIGCVWYQRTLNGGKHLPPAPWSLGRYGSWINGIGWLYSVYVFFWCTWPPLANPPLDTVNWAPVMFGGVLILSLVYYFVWGRRIYTGPVALVRS